jgi:excisionase family DNA binding protein
MTTNHALQNTSTPLAPGDAAARPERLTLTNAEIRALTGLGRDKVLELLRAGVIPSVRAGRRYLVTRAHIDAFLNGETRQA